MDHLEHLYREHGPALLAWLSRRAPAHAADLLHDTFLAAARRPGDLARAESPRAWLFAVARNLAISRWRRQRLCEPLADTVAPTVAEDPRRERMTTAIAELDEVHREILDLRLGQDLSYAELAQVLGIPVGTVRSRLHYAVARIRERIHKEKTDADT